MKKLYSIANSTAYIPLLGTPYKDRDCYGIAVDFYRLVFEVDLKSYYEEIPQNRDIAKNLIYSSLGDFKKVEVADRQFGDLILIRLYGVDSHIGIYLGDGKMLHTNETTGCCIERLARWEKLIVGYYRVEK